MFDWIRKRFRPWVNEEPPMITTESIINDTAHTDVVRYMDLDERSEMTVAEHIQIESCPSPHHPLTLDEKREAQQIVISVLKSHSRRPPKSEVI